MEELLIKNNRLFFNGKKLPTYLNEITGKITYNNIDYLVLEINNLNIFPKENNCKRLTGNPKFKKLKVIKPIPGLFSELEKGDIIKLNTIIVKREEIISEETVISKELLFNIKKI